MFHLLFFLFFNYLTITLNYLFLFKSLVTKFFRKSTYSTEVDLKGKNGPEKEKNIVFFTF